MIRFSQNDEGNYIIDVSPIPENKLYMGYIHKPIYKFLGMCPHRFYQGIALKSLSSNGNMSTAIIKSRGNGMKPIRVQKLFKISEGFQITLDEGLRAAIKISKALKNRGN